MSTFQLCFNAEITYWIHLSSVKVRIARSEYLGGQIARVALSRRVVSVTILPFCKVELMVSYWSLGNSRPGQDQSSHGPRLLGGSGVFYSWLSLYVVVVAAR